MQDMGIGLIFSANLIANFDATSIENGAIVSKMAKLYARMLKLRY